MKHKTLDHTHRMTLHNYDLIIKWHYVGDEIKLSEVTMIFAGHNSNLMQFMSERVFQAIVDDIKKQQDWDGRK
jgi:hypothetical protein